MSEIVSSSPWIVACSVSRRRRKPSNCGRRRTSVVSCRSFAAISFSSASLPDFWTSYSISVSLSFS